MFHRQRCDYWGDPFNLVDIGSVSLLLAVVPLRVMAVSPAHWYLYSLGYLLMTTRVFKYAAVFRCTTGGYMCERGIVYIIQSIPLIA